MRSREEDGAAPMAQETARPLSLGDAGTGINAAMVSTGGMTVDDPAMAAVVVCSNGEGTSDSISDGSNCLNVFSVIHRYNKIKAAGKDFEIIFVSSDRVQVQQGYLQAFEYVPPKQGPTLHLKSHQIHGEQRRQDSCGGRNSH